MESQAAIIAGLYAKISLETGASCFQTASFRLVSDGLWHYHNQNCTLCGHTEKTEIMNKTEHLSPAAKAEILSEATALKKAIKKATSLTTMHAVSDVKAQMENLVYPGFVAKTGYDQLVHIPRYLKAAQVRLTKLGPNLHRDNQLMLTVQDLEDSYDNAVKSLPAGTIVPDALRRVNWMIEELRVSFFAQELGTAYTVSEKRIAKAQREALDAIKR